MKTRINYYDIEHESNMFAVPTFTRDEVVEHDNEQQLENYIQTQRDLHGFSYQLREDKFMGYDYISGQGGIKLEAYEPEDIKDLNE